MPWLVLLFIAAAGAGVIWKLAPARDDATDVTAGTQPAGSSAAPPPAARPAAPDGSVNLDSIAAIERELQAQVDEARRIALAAERRADALAASRQGGAAPGSATQGAPAHAHLYVFAQGGAPLVVIDGTPRNEVAPAVFQLTPGRHTVSVRGNQQFFPRDTTIVLVPEDTQTVVFRSLRFAGQRTPQQPSVGGADPLPEKPFIQAPQGDAGQKPALPVDWPDIVRKLGFDPRTADLRRLTPEQRQRLRRFQEMMDSLRRATARRP